MDVRCERCKAQYVFDDDQVTSAGLTVQCTNCGHLFRIRKKQLVVTVPLRPGDLEGTPLTAKAAAPRPVGTQAATPAAAPAARPPPPSLPTAEADRPREWRVRQASGNTFTFRELTTLQKWIIEQKVGRDDEISLSGDQWKRLGNIAELASFFQVVEAAERSRTHLPALTPLPGLTPLPMPVYGVAGQGPAPYPPPPSGYPPPAFTTPPPPAPPAPEALPPGDEVDLGIDEAPPKARRDTRTWLAPALVVAVLGAGAYVALPLVLERRAPPRPPEPAAPPITAELRPAPPPPEPPPAPVAAPEPEPEPPPPSPAPIAKPAPTPAPPKGPKQLLARAKFLLEKGDARAAVELFGRVLSQDQDNVEAQVGRGLCYLDLESLAPAEASFQAALRLQPDHADALLGLAETYRYRGQKTEAIAAYERYLARYPDGEEAEVAKNALAELRK